jgi:HrpA-like RNA helicase
MAHLVRDLILHLHSTEPDADAVILVFLPTYKALLLQHKLLTESAPAATGMSRGDSELDVFALHSSVDIDEALEAIQAPVAGGRRRVVLATNCAESSITVPNVKHVVDSCTTNQVCAGACCSSWDWAVCLNHRLGVPKSPMRLVAT